MQNLTRYIFLAAAIMFLFSCENQTSEESPADTALTIETPNNQAAPTVEPRQTLERLSGTCTELEDSGCFCEYRLKGDHVQEAAFFASDMGMTACVQVNGQVIRLKSQEAVYRQELLQLVDYAKNNTDWIVLPKEGPIQYFGQPLPKGKDATEYMSHILLLMDKIPSKVPIRNEAEGMAIREVSEMAAYAVKKARGRQENADFMYFKEVLYYNDQYELIVDTKQVTDHEGEANSYEGDLILKDKAGTELHTQPVSGTCGC